MFEKQKQWASRHIYLNNLHHFAGGFGLALVLQYYFAGGLFIPVIVGWALLAFTLIMHLYVNLKK